MQELVKWPFDFCLVTYSGDGEQGIGIGAHRDASYADYKAYGLNVSQTAKFDYWMGRPSFGPSRETQAFDAKRDQPTHSLILQPGQLVRFNCKNLHSCQPETRRWNINFWRRKPY